MLINILSRIRPAVWHSCSVGEQDIIFSGDACKNRAELISSDADMTYDPAITRASIATIWALWEAKPGSIVVPGHELPMILEDGKPRYLGER